MTLHCLDQGDPDDAEGYVRYHGQRITCEEASKRMNVIYTRSLLFQSSQIFRNYSYWGFSTNFASLHQDERIFIDKGDVHPDVEIRSIYIPGIGNQMGLFTTKDVQGNTLLGEYTGVVQLDHGKNHDSYGLAYPSAYEGGNMSISAKEYGNIIRCINHSYTKFNSRFTSIVHDGILRMICRTIDPVPCNTQILINYGASYWKEAGIQPFEW